jgi:iron(III) transport system substrate-binding protein
MRTARHVRATVAALAAMALVTTACGGESGAEGGDAGASEESTAGGGGSTTQDGEESDLVAAAKEEGAVTIYTGAHTRPAVELLASEFEEAYGIPVTFTRQSSGDTVQMLEAELASGSVNADVVGLNDESTFQRWAEEGVTTTVDIPNRDQLMEVVGTDDAPHVSFTFVPMGVAYNTQEVSPDDLAGSWAELPETLADQRVVMADPNASGAALFFAAGVGELAGDDFFSRIGDQQEVLVTDSALAMTQMLATGVATVANPSVESEVIAAAEAGEPIDMITMEEGLPTVLSQVAAVEEAPHPNAAALLVQFHLSEQYQTALAEMGGRSVLQDGPAPAGREALTSEQLLVPDAAETMERREEIGQAFNTAFGR